MQHQDTNLGPLGYEPNTLPLRQPAADIEIQDLPGKFPCQSGRIFCYIINFTEFFASYVGRLMSWKTLLELFTRSLSFL